MPISGQSAHPCNADIFSVNNIILASFFQYNKPHGELNNLFFENQFLSKLQFKYCLTLNISNIFNTAIDKFSLIEYDETILKVQPVKYRYVLQINLLRKEEFFMFTYGTSDIAQTGRFA